MVVFIEVLFMRHLLVHLIIELQSQVFDHFLRQLLKLLAAISKHFKLLKYYFTMVATRFSFILAPLTPVQAAAPLPMLPVPLYLVQPSLS
jgi:hypothetical protein